MKKLKKKIHYLEDNFQSLELNENILVIVEKINQLFLCKKHKKK